MKKLLSPSTWSSFSLILAAAYFFLFAAIIISIPNEQERLEISKSREVGVVSKILSIGTCSLAVELTTGEQHAFTDDCESGITVKTGDRLCSEGNIMWVAESC